MSYKIILNVQRQLLRNTRNIYHYGGLSNLIVLNSFFFFFFFTDTYKRIRSQIYQALPLLELDTFMNCERLVPIEFNVSFFVCLVGWVFFRWVEGGIYRETGFPFLWMPLFKCAPALLTFENAVLIL